MTILVRLGGSNVVSMKDIARCCGVSVATVSKALNGQPDIGVETRERINAVAAELGYMTNSAARALKTSRTYNLGILLVDERRNGLTHEYFSALLESFKVEAEAHGYDITFINRNVGGKSTSYLQHCKYRGVDGLAIACVNFSDPQVREVADSSLPLVTFDYMFPNRMAVMSDNVGGMESLVRYVYGKGHREIAYIHGEKSAVTADRLLGFRRACENLGLRVPEEYLVESFYHDPEGCARATKKLMTGSDRPSCILFPDDYSAMGGLRALAELGLRIPEDISVAGYDGINLAQVIGLTTFCQNAQVLGRTGAQKLIGLIENPEENPPERTLIAGQIAEGDTVRTL